VPGEVSGAGDFGLGSSLLPFTGASLLWLIRIGVLLVAVGPWFVCLNRRRVSTVLRHGRI
jgi:hypothetical protein